MMKHNNNLFIFSVLILFYSMYTADAMECQKKDASHDSDGLADDSQWRIVYSPIEERRNQQGKLSPYASSSKSSIELEDYDPIGSNCASEVGESSVDGKVITNDFDQEPERLPIQVTIIKKQEEQNTYYKPIVLAAVTIASTAGFALGWFTHYMHIK